MPSYNEQDLLTPRADNDYDMVSITTYVPTDDKYVLKDKMFGNMNDDDMRYIQNFIEIKSFNVKSGGWIIDEKWNKLQAITWDISSKKFHIIYRYKLHSDWKVYNTNRTSNMKLLAISMIKLDRYKKQRSILL
jgi:hypothetical protein